MERVLRFRYDPTADVAFVALQPIDVVQPSVAATITVNPDLNLDYDDAGRLVGVEILAAHATLHPALLSEEALSRDDLGLLGNALNEVLHGPDAIEEWEFETRMGATRDEATRLLARLRGASA